MKLVIICLPGDECLYALSELPRNAGYYAVQRESLKEVLGVSHGLAERQAIVDTY